MRAIVKKQLSSNGNPYYHVYVECKGIFFKKWKLVEYFSDEKIALKKAEEASVFDGRVVAEYIDGIRK